MSDEKPKSIVELYKELEAEGMTRSSGRGEKATKVRGIVTDIGKQTGKNKLMMSLSKYERSFLLEWNKSNLH